MKAKLVSFIAGMLFMVTFGIIDNAFLVIGMNSLDSIIPMHNSPILSAMWGNTMSDAIGASLGILVAITFKKLFKVKPSSHVLVELIGVVVGCLIPIAIYTLL